MRTIRSFIADTGGYINGMSLVALTIAPVVIGLGEYGQAHWLDFHLGSQTGRIASDIATIAKTAGDGKEMFGTTSRMTAVMREWADALTEGYIDPQLRPRLVSFAVARATTDQLRVTLRIEGGYTSFLTRMARLGTVKMAGESAVEASVGCLPRDIPLDRSEAKPFYTRNPNNRIDGKAPVHPRFPSILMDDESLASDRQSSTALARCPTVPLPSISRAEIVEGARGARQEPFYKPFVGGR